MDRPQAIISEIRKEYVKIRSIGNAYEGIALLKEEYDKLWKEIKEGQNKYRMENVAVQIAATAVRFATDVCGV